MGARNSHDRYHQQTLEKWKREVFEVSGWKQKCLCTILLLNKAKKITKVLWKNGNPRFDAGVWKHKSELILLSTILFVYNFVSKHSTYASKKSQTYNYECNY